jgi:acetoacetate decarboxylase
MAGGRELWAIPKGLSDFTLESTRSGPLSRTSWAASDQRLPLASADFTDLSRAAPRLPFRGLARQPGIEDTRGAPRTAAMRGTARMLPCRGRWEFPASGPLAWLGRARPVASCRMADFRLSFG